MSDFRSALKQHFWCGGSSGKCTFRQKQQNSVEMQALSAPALCKLTDKLALETTSSDPKTYTSSDPRTYTSSDPKTYTDLESSDPKSFSDLACSDPKSFADMS